MHVCISLFCLKLWDKILPMATMIERMPSNVNIWHFHGVRIWLFHLIKIWHSHLNSKSISSRFDDNMNISNNIAYLPLNEISFTLNESFNMITALHWRHVGLPFACFISKTKLSKKSLKWQLKWQTFCLLLLRLSFLPFSRWKFMKIVNRPKRVFQLSKETKEALNNSFRTATQCIYTQYLPKATLIRREITIGTFRESK